MKIKVIDAKNKSHIGKIIDMGENVTEYELNGGKAIMASSLSDFNNGTYKVVVQYPNQFSDTMQANLSRFINGEWAAKGGLTLKHVEILVDDTKSQLLWEDAHRDLQISIKANNWNDAIEACQRLKSYNI